MSDGPVVCGVDVNIVLMVGAQTMEHGKIISRRPFAQVFQCQIMGTTYRYTGYFVAGAASVRWGTMNVRAPQSESTGCFCHKIDGLNWSVFVVTSRSASSDYRWRKVDPPRAGDVRWGSCYYFCRHLEFSGDEEEFRREMLYATMIGDKWNAIFEATRNG
jgi:hypothetical protein